ncbi:ABC 3 transport family protein [Planctomycetes bacterium Poly30]|uniref:ABC 3 transport family protein n=1 Tax=Saltatorellus ferox TaxID=2528018 RepID=A0A518EXA8_9BACT|nr:ABC 3 transport family protein [Planctomycetes bacterium Poly30]
MDLSTFVQLFTWPLIALGLVALTAPVVGAFLVARGTAFHGIALPQVAAFGVAVGFALLPFVQDLPWTVAGDGHSHGSAEPSRGYLALCAAVFVVAALGLFETRRGRGGRGDQGATVAATFAIASGGTALAAQLSPLGGIHVGALLGGETLSTGPFDAAVLGGVALLVLAATIAGWRPITLAGLDPEYARAAGKRPRLADLTLHAMTAVLVIAGSLTVGALPMFALLVIPAMVVRDRSASMARFLVAAPALGLASASVGAGLAFRFDLSMDASVVAGCVLAGGGAGLGGALLAVRRRARSSVSNSSASD